jgi:hypothetical protein
MIKTFRGQLTDGAQDTINLKTNDGSMGYRIVKFQGLTNEPGQNDYESTLKIYKIEQTAFNNTVDFSDNTLLGVWFGEGTASGTASSTFTTIFDREIFNQDIYITHSDTASSSVCNYYIELEQVKLNLNENTVATLKDIRNSTEV